MVNERVSELIGIDAPDTAIEVAGWYWAEIARVEQDLEAARAQPAP